MVCQWPCGTLALSRSPRRSRDVGNHFHQLIDRDHLLRADIGQAFKIRLATSLRGLSICARRRGDGGTTFENRFGSPRARPDYIRYYCEIARLWFFVAGLSNFALIKKPAPAG
jgi:hypothetical protein